MAINLTCQTWAYLKAFSGDNTATEVAPRSKPAAVEMKYLHNLFFQEFMWCANTFIRAASSVLCWSCQAGGSSEMCFWERIWLSALNRHMVGLWQGVHGTVAPGRKQLDVAILLRGCVPVIGHGHMLHWFSSSIAPFSWTSWAAKTRTSVMCRAFVSPCGCGWRRMAGAVWYWLFPTHCASWKVNVSPATRLLLLLTKPKPNSRNFSIIKLKARKLLLWAQNLQLLHLCWKCVWNQHCWAYFWPIFKQNCVNLSANSSWRVWVVEFVDSDARLHQQAMRPRISLSPTVTVPQLD